MSEYAVAKRAVAWKGEISLVTQADTKLFQSNPTLATGDVKVAKDDGALANLTTLPYSTNSDKRVEVALSATEMTADNVYVIFSDAAGAQWCDQGLNIQTGTRALEDLAYPATSGRSLVVDANGLADATTVKIGPTGAGTAQTAKDVGNAVPSAAPNAAGGLLTFGTSSGQLNPSSGKVTTTYGIVKNTAFTNFEFEMVLSSDNVSPATGKTVTATRSIDGGAYAACANAVSEVSGGTYKINLAAADDNGNAITYAFAATGCNTTKIGLITQS